MAEKNMNARIQMKGDTLANWQKATGFVPLENEFLLVTDTGGTLRGDGKTTAAVLAGVNGTDIKYFQAPADVIKESVVVPSTRVNHGEELLSNIIDNIESKLDELIAITNDEIDAICVERLEGDGQEFYTMAPSTLTFRSTAPLNELQDIQINGQTVDPSTYELEEGSTIVKLKQDYLSTLGVGNYELSVVSDSKTVKGDFSVAAPELNEYGFYYDEPYLNADYGIILFFSSNNIVRVCYYTEGWEGSADYSIENNHIVYEWEGSTFNLTIQGNTLVAEDSTTYSADVPYDKNYLYLYNADLECYDIMVKDRSKESYPDPKITINNIPVSGIAGFGFGECHNLTSIEIPKNIIHIGISAFSGCSSLQEVILHEGITSIEEGAFSYLDSLNYATYDGCSYLGSRSNPYIALISVTVPQPEYNVHENTILVSSYAFFDMLECEYNVVISSSVKYIGHFSFFQSMLTNVTFDGESELISIGHHAFALTLLTSIELPHELNELPAGEFLQTPLESVTIPSSIVRIGEEAFSDCSNLANIIFQGTCSQWGSIQIHDNWCNRDTGDFSIHCTDGLLNRYSERVNCFSYRIRANNTCIIIGLGTVVGSDVIIPKYIDNYEVTSIGDRAFPGRQHLTSITIPDSVTSIGYKAFSSCTSLTSIEFAEDSKLTSIGEDAFYNCTSLTSITIPNSVTSIGDYAFRGCSSLEIIELPNSVTSIGYSAFNGCSNLTSITIPDGVKSIGDCAFPSCTSLTSITIPDSVTSIGAYAFGSCYNLTSVIFNGTIAQWNAITKSFNWNYNVPATYVQCSDGQVAL